MIGAKLIGNKASSSIDYSLTQIDVDSVFFVITQWINLAKINDNHIAVAINDNQSDGFLATVKTGVAFNELGTVDSLEIEPVTGYRPSVVSIDSTHLAVTIVKNNFDLYLQTYSYDGAYDNITFINEILIDLDGTNSELIKIDDTHLLLVYQDSGNKGNAVTILIDGAYLPSIIDSTIFSTLYFNELSIDTFDSTHFLVSSRGDYTSGGTGGGIAMLSIDGSFMFSTIKTLDFPYLPFITNIIKLNNSQGIVIFRDNATNESTIQSFSIDGSYNLALQETFINDTTAQAHDLVKLDDTRFMSLHCTNLGASSRPYFKIYSVSSGGVISLEFATAELELATGQYCKFVRLDNTHIYTCWYRGSNITSGKTYEITF